MELMVASLSWPQVCEELWNAHADRLLLLAQFDDVSKALANGRETNRPVCVSEEAPPKGFVWLKLPGRPLMILEPALDYKEPKDPPPDNPSARLKRAVENLLTVQYTDLPLSEFFFVLAEFDVHVKPDPAVDLTLKIPLKGKNVPVAKLLKDALAPHGLEFRLDQDLVIVDVSKDARRGGRSRSPKSTRLLGLLKP
jgi:hypothetical protein